MEKINVAELLKDCPKGMELNCLMYDGCTFDGIAESEDYPIKIQAPDGAFVFTKYGSISEIESAKCVIFPKGKTTWKGFQRPFKDGDIVAIGDKLSVQVFIFKEYIKARNNYVRCYMMLDNDETLNTKGGKYYVPRLATEEEKQKLFKAIKDNGYRWNAETKTLEKLVEPKFDITTLRPFDKVLVRDEAEEQWRMEFFWRIDNNKFMFACYRHSWIQCIPYEGNEHLLNTTDNCDDFYITWNN